MGFLDDCRHACYLLAHGRWEIIVSRPFNHQFNVQWSRPTLSLQPRTERRLSFSVTLMLTCSTGSEVFRVNTSGPVNRAVYSIVLSSSHHTFVTRYVLMVVLQMCHCSFMSREIRINLCEGETVISGAGGRSGDGCCEFLRPGIVGSLEMCGGYVRVFMDFRKLALSHTEKDRSYGVFHKESANVDEVGKASSQDQEW